nr:hypothetical protein [Tanacetum cinerariifolium]
MTSIEIGAADDKIIWSFVACEDSGRQILQSNPLQTIIKGVANIIERPVAKLIGLVRVELRKVELLLVAFHSQLKVFHASLDDNAPVNILRETLKARRSSTVRLPVNCIPIEPFTFSPPVRNSPEGVLVVVYWLLYPHLTGHQIFDPFDVPIICRLRLSYGSCIFTARCTSPKILEVVVDEVFEWNYPTTSMIQYQR